MNKLVIYHAGCADGFCAAWQLWREFGDAAEYLPAQYGDAPPDVTGKRVWIVDFSYPREVLEDLHRQAESLVVLDHHKSAEEELKDLPYCTFDMAKSGAQLTWDWLMENHFSYCGPYPPLASWLVDYTADRDLWKWELDCSREVNAALRSYPMDFGVWNKLAKKPWEEKVPEGRAILRYQQQAIDAKVFQAHKITLLGRTGYAVNTTTLVSEIAGALAEREDADFGLGWFELPDRHRVYSLRSPGKLDVSIMAKQFGGGGHANAAGFTAEVHPWEVYPCQ